MATNLETRQLPLLTAIVKALVTVGCEALSGKIVNSIAGKACASALTCRAIPEVTNSRTVAK